MAAGRVPEALAALNPVPQVLTAAQSRDPRAAVVAAGAMLLACAAPVMVVKALHDLGCLARMLRPWLRLAPAPSGFWEPLTGNALEMVKGIYNWDETTGAAWDVLQRWCRESKERGEGVFRFRVMDRLCVGSSDWRALKRIYQTRFHIYQKDLEWSFKEFLGILGGGIVTSHGDKWRQQRKFMTPVLKERILEMVPRVSQAAFERLRGKLDGEVGRAVEMEEEFRLLTLQVIGDVLLSVPPEECNQVFPEIYLPVMEEANRRVLAPWRRYLFFLPAFWRYERRLAQLNAYLTRIIRQRWADLEAGRSGDPGHEANFLTQLILELRARGHSYDAETEVQLCDEMKTLLLAGHETSAAMLTFATHELFSDPALLARVREEADRWLPPGGGVPSREQVDRLELTHAVLKETLRKWSVVPVITRWASEDDELLGKRVPRGTFVMLSIKEVHHGYWQEPAAFRPERFLPGGEYERFPDDQRPFMFIPFSAGPRNCLGQYLSLMEARIVLARLAQAYTLTPDPAPVKTCNLVIPVATDDGLRFTVAPNDGGFEDARESGAEQ